MLGEDLLVVFSIVFALLKGREAGTLVLVAEHPRIVLMILRKFHLVNVRVITRHARRDLLLTAMLFFIGGLCVQWSTLTLHRILLILLLLQFLFLRSPRSLLQKLHFPRRIGTRWNQTSRSRLIPGCRRRTDILTAATRRRLINTPSACKLVKLLSYDILRFQEILR